MKSYSPNSVSEKKVVSLNHFFKYVDISYIEWLAYKFELKVKENLMSIQGLEKGTSVKYSKKEKLGLKVRF